MIRDTLKQIPGLKSAYYLSVALRQMAGDQWREPSAFDDIFAESEDPWGSGSEAERRRFAVTLAMLDEAEPNRFSSAVELGCAEGIFTEIIAPRCDSLLGLDYSSVALKRARANLADFPNVRFQKWDMRDFTIDGEYDLVIAMGVITSLYRPGDVKKACRMVVDAMKPGGYLLFSDVRQSTVFEDAWWGRLVLRGGEQIRRLLTNTSELELIVADDTPSHVFALYRRRAA